MNQKKHTNPAKRLKRVNKEDLKIVFMGSSDFAVPALEALHKAGYRIPYVVTQPDRMRGRGNKVKPTPVGMYALENGLSLIKPESLKEDGDHMRKLYEAAPDLIVVASYGKILPKPLLDLPPLGCVNMHASLLPEYRGAAPVQRVILDGKEETGVTLIYLSEGLDNGDMITSVSVPVSDMNAGELTDVLSRVGAELLIDTLPMLMDGTAPRIPQDENKATYAGKIEKADGHLDLGDKAENIVRRVRAMTPVPGAFVLEGGERIVITKARIARPDLGAVPIELYEAKEPGTTLSVSGEGIYVRTGDGLLLIEELKMPGKKAMPVREYLKGNEFDTTLPLE